MLRGLSVLRKRITTGITTWHAQGSVTVSPWTPALSLDHHIKTEKAEIRAIAEKSPERWRHRIDLQWSKRGPTGSTFRDLGGCMYLFWKEKKQPHNTHEKTYYLWELHVSFRIHEGVCNASEVDFSGFKYRWTDGISGTYYHNVRQKLAATVIIAEIKLTENQTPMGLRAWMSHKVKSRYIPMHTMLFLKMYFNSQTFVVLHGGWWVYNIPDKASLED